MYEDDELNKLLDLQMNHSQYINCVSYIFQALKTIPQRFVFIKEYQNNQTLRFESPNFLKQHKFRVRNSSHRSTGSPVQSTEFLKSQ